MNEPEEALAAADVFALQGRSAIVTGASSGLGERFARVLVANGVRVLAVARRAERLEALASENANVVPFAADLAVETDRTRVVDAALEEFGRIDVLVNNAGYGKPTPALAEAVSDFRDVLEVNLVAVFELARLAARAMIEQGSGSIINVASIYGLVASTPVPNASYNASKGAVINLSRELGCQWARKGVRVNALAPGFFPSESTDGLEGSSLGDYVNRNCPMGRIGALHELDGVLLFLASDASSYVTGQVLTVDGGWTAR